MIESLRCRVCGSWHEVADYLNKYDLVCGHCYRLGALATYYMLEPAEIGDGFLCLDLWGDDEKATNPTGADNDNRSQVTDSS